MDEMVDWLAGAVDNGALHEVLKLPGSAQQAMNSATIGRDGALELAAVHRRLIHLYRAQPGYDQTWRPADTRPPDAGPNRQEPDV